MIMSCEAGLSKGKKFNVKFLMKSEPVSRRLLTIFHINRMICSLHRKLMNHCCLRENSKNLAIFYTKNILINIIFRQYYFLT